MNCLNKNCGTVNTVSCIAQLTKPQAQHSIEALSDACLAFLQCFFSVVGKYRHLVEFTFNFTISIQTK